jgi:tetratricopeptide (TPR) repeat protein
MEDYLCASFVAWVEAIGLHHLAQKIRELEAMESFSMAYLSFLSLTDYLPKAEISALQKDLSAWEKRQLWEKLKEQGDFWLGLNNGEQAFGFYSKALRYQENAALLNNAGVALMYMGDFEAAAELFGQALRLDPYNVRLCFNFIEAMIFYGDYEKAHRFIKEADALAPGHPELMYFQAEIQFRQKNYLGAIGLYTAALALDYEPAYVYRLSDCYMHIRQFDKALEILEQIKEADQNSEFLKKQAQHQAKAGNLPRAIKSLEKALMSDNSQVELWIMLATYHRMDYNLTMAQGAISKALAVAPENPAALLEQARIRKAGGRTKEYQGILHKLLAGFKKDYRKAVGG